MAKKYRVRDTGKTRRRMRHSGKTYPKVDVIKLIEGLEADVVEPVVDSKGLEVIFNIPLVRHTHNRGIGNFPLECLDGFNLEKRKVIFSQDYGVWQSLSYGFLLFRSEDPDRPLMFVHKDNVVSIRNPSINKVLYQK